MRVSGILLLRFRKEPNPLLIFRKLARLEIALPLYLE